MKTTLYPPARAVTRELAVKLYGRRRSTAIINHVRTLLLNRKPDNVPYGGQPGDEYLPIDYVPLTSLPAYLRSLRATLFGTDTDRLYGNYRVRQYLSLLHATELVEFVAELDPRITYDPDNPDLLDPDLFRLVPPDNSIHVIGELGSPDSSGRSRHEWDIRILTSSTIEVQRQSRPRQHSVQDYEFTDGLSNLLQLVGSEAKFRIADGAVSRWTLAGYARPERDLGAIAAELESTGAQYMNQLFGVGTPLAAAEPFKTFRNLWYDHPELAYKLGGLLLALVYRMEALRKHA